MFFLDKNSLNDNQHSLYIMVSGNRLSLRKLPAKHLSERRRHHETCQRPCTVWFNQSRKTPNRELGSNTPSGTVCCVFSTKNFSSVCCLFDNRVHWQIVEELEDRFGGDRIDEILGHVKESLMQPHSDTVDSHGINGALSVQQSSLIVEQDHWDLDADAPYEEDMYDDTGEGAGVEGDLDMEED